MTWLRSHVGSFHGNFAMQKVVDVCDAFSVVNEEKECAVGGKQAPEHDKPPTPLSSSRKTAF